MKQKMHVIFVCDKAFIGGGAEKVAIAEAIALAERGCDITFFAGLGPVEERLVEAGVKVICMNQLLLSEQLTNMVGKLKGAFQGLFGTEVKKRFAAFLDTVSPDNTIVHFHTWVFALSPSLFSITAQKRFKVAITVHDYQMSCPERTYFNYKDGRICSCNAMTAKCMFTNCDVRRSYLQKTYRVIRNLYMTRLLKKNDLAFLYPARLIKDTMDKNLHLNRKDFILDNPVEIRQVSKLEPQKNSRYLYIGRIVREKGVDLFCDAVTKEKVPADVIGDGEEKERLMKLYPNITFYGWLSSIDMEPVIRKARCMIVTSLWMEIGPLVVPEVQCTYGLPCIVPSLCGWADDIRAAKTGMVYEIGNEASLLECIQLCKRDEQIEEFAANCRGIDINKYSEKTHIDRLGEIYENILSGRYAV